MKKFALALLVTLAALAAPVMASPQTVSAVADETTCLSSGYYGTKLRLCIYICEESWRFTDAQLNAMLRTWLLLDRRLPYCAL